MDPQEQTSVKIEPKSHYFHSRKWENAFENVICQMAAIIYLLPYYVMMCILQAPFYNIAHAEQ